MERFFLSPLSLRFSPFSSANRTIEFIAANMSEYFSSTFSSIRYLFCELRSVSFRLDFPLCFSKECLQQAFRCMLFGITLFQRSGGADCVCGTRRFLLRDGD